MAADSPVQRPTDPEDPRVHHLVHSDDGTAQDVVLLGAPFDGGVVAGGGREGAAEGPSAVRRALRRAGAAYHLEHDLSLADLRIGDAGDLDVSGDTLEVHARLEGAVVGLLARGAVPVIIGGGHDLTYATVAGLAAHVSGPVGGVNIDAHLDVRPVRDGVITSGTPFRRALETLPSFDGSRFIVLGPHGNRNARAHVEWLRARGGRIITLAEARRMGTASAMETALSWAAGGDGKDSPLSVSPCLRGESFPAFFVSLDVDSAAQAFAPGCSAPSPDGFGPDDLLTFAFLAGRHLGVACFDVMEVNPRFDHDGRTAALAAAAIVHFLFGLVERQRVSALRRC